jgi:tRNA (guanine37-N1)-methyltransferase
VPDVLLSGHHDVIEKWRRGQALLRTRMRRPDLFDRFMPTREDLRLLREAEEKGT